MTSYEQLTKRLTYVQWLVYLTLNVSLRHFYSVRQILGVGPVSQLKQCRRKNTKDKPKLLYIFLFRTLPTILVPPNYCRKIGLCDWYQSEFKKCWKNCLSVLRVFGKNMNNIVFRNLWYSKVTQENLINWQNANIWQTTFPHNWFVVW